MSEPTTDTATTFQREITRLFVRTCQVEQEIESLTDEHIRPRKDELKSIRRLMRTRTIEAASGQGLLGVDG